MRYEPAAEPARGPQPGALALRDYAAARGFADKGIYNPRTVRGGTALSLHAEGRAVDLTHERTGNTADDLSAFVDRLIAHHERLGVQQVIWWGRVWTVGRGWRTYTGSAGPHKDHAHVELTRAAAAGLTVATLITILEEDDMPTAQEIAEALLSAEVPEHDFGTGQTRKVQLRQLLSDMHMELGLLRTRQK